MQYVNNFHLLKIEVWK